MIVAPDFLKWLEVFNVVTGSSSPFPAPIANRVLITDSSASMEWANQLPDGTQINNPVNPLDIVNKQYADNIAASGAAVYAISAAALVGYTYDNGSSGVGATLTAPSNGVFSLDGVVIPVGANVLVKDQVDSTQNGIYTLTTSGAGVHAVLTRATNYDTPTQINTTGNIVATHGATNLGLSYYLNSYVTTIGTDPLTYTQYGTAAYNIVGGLANQLLYQTAPSTTGFVGAPSAYSVLGSDSTGVPIWEYSTQVENVPYDGTTLTDNLTYNYYPTPNIPTGNAATNIYTFTYNNTLYANVVYVGNSIAAFYTFVFNGLSWSLLTTTSYGISNSDAYHGCVFTQGGNTFFASSIYNNGQVRIYQFNGSTWSFVTNQTGINAPMGIATDVIGGVTYLYMSSSITGNGFYVSSFNGTTLTPVGGLTATGSGANQIVAYVESSVHYLSITNTVAGTFSTYSFNGTTLTQINTPIASGTSPGQLSTIVISGTRYLVVSNFDSNTITTYSWASPGWTLSSTLSSVVPGASALKTYAYNGSSYLLIVRPDPTNAFKLYVFSGGVWTAVASVISTQTPASNPGIGLALFDIGTTKAFVFTASTAGIGYCQRLLTSGALTVSYAPKVTTNATGGAGPYPVLYTPSASGGNQVPGFKSNFTYSPDTNVLLVPSIQMSSLTASQAVVTDASKNLISLAYTSANTASTLMSRDGSGNFSAAQATLSSIIVSGATNPLIRSIYTGAQSTTSGGATQNVQDDGTALLTGNRLGSFSFLAAYDTSHTYNVGAAMRAFATENWSVSANGTQLQFLTTANTTTTQTIALTLDQNQNATFSKSLGVGVAPTNTVDITRASAATSGVLQYLMITPKSDTGLTASTNVPIVSTSSATRTWATGAASVLSDVYLSQPTFAFAGSSTVSYCGTQVIQGPPIPGNNSVLQVTAGLLITQSSILASGSGVSQIGAGLVCFAPTNAGSGNVCALFMGLPASGKGVGVGTTNVSATLHVTRDSASTSNAFPYLTIIPTADTGITASTECPIVNIGSAIRTWATGALTTQRANLFNQPTIAFAGASTCATAANVAINGPTIAGTNSTITAAHALLISAGSSLTTNVAAGYGLTVNAPTGATANYCAAFLGGNVGVGVATPTSPLQVQGTGAAFTDYGMLTAEDSSRNGISFGYDTSLNQAWIASRTFGVNGRVLNLNNSLFVSRSTFAQSVINVGVGATTSSIFNVTRTNANSTGNTDSYLTVSAKADTSLGATVEVPLIKTVQAIRTWAAGTINNQRDTLFNQPTIAFAGASTVNAAANVAINGPTIAGTNATLGSSIGLFIDTGASVTANATYAYGLLAKTPIGGTNNVAIYADAICIGSTPTGTQLLGTILTAPPASNTVTTAFGASLTAGTAKQNTTGYDILVNISVNVTSSTTATLVMGVGTTSTPTTNTVVASFSAATATVFNFTAYVPAGYYLLVNTTGTIVIGSITTQACGI